MNINLALVYFQALHFHSDDRDVLVERYLKATYLFHIPMRRKSFRNFLNEPQSFNIIPRSKCAFYTPEFCEDKDILYDMTIPVLNHFGSFGVLSRKSKNRPT